MLSNEEKIDLLDTLEDNLNNCIKCSLCNTKKNTIIGYGSLKSKVLIIREYPEFEEDRTGNLWASPSARLFNNILHAAHIDSQKIYTTYLVHCRPIDNKMCSEYINNCNSHVEEIIKIIEPKIIVTCGRQVLQYFMGKTKNVSKVRGNFFVKDTENIGEILIFPLHHPTSMIKLPNVRKKEMFDDLNILFSKMIELKIVA
jgi:uracil-DNA glycosylase